MEAVAGMEDMYYMVEVVAEEVEFPACTYHDSKLILHQPCYDCPSDAAQQVLQL